MKYYEWELHYLNKKIKQCQTRIDKAKESGNSYRIIMAEREMEALNIIYNIVKDESDHLKRSLAR